MRKYTLCFLISLSTFLTATSRPQPIFKKHPDWIKKYSYQFNHHDNKDVSDGYLYLLREQQTNVSLATTYFHYVRKIYAELGVQNGSEINISFDPSYQTLIFHKIEIRRGNQTIDKLDLDAIKIIQRETNLESQIYDGRLSAILHLEDVRVNDIIDYSFSVVGRNPIYQGKFFTSFYLGYYDPTDVIIQRIIVSSQKKLTYKSFNTDFEPSIEKHDHYTIYEWYGENIPGLISDDQTPSWYDPYPQVWISEFKAWQEVNVWALPLYKVPKIKSGPLREKIEEIKKNHDAPTERIEASVKFVQNEIRYLGLEGGIGAYQPFPPEKVLIQRFGDCKDKSLLLATMLQNMDIKAYPALVSTYEGHTIHTRPPSPISFNHCIVQVQHGSQTLWYDPTIAYQEGTFDNIYFPNYETALVISQETIDLVSIPFTPSGKTEILEHFTIHNFDSAASFNVRTDYHGWEADRQRRYFHDNSLTQIEKNYLNYYANTYPEIEQVESIQTIDDREKNIFTTIESYQISNFWQPIDSSQLDDIYCEVYPQMLRDQISSPSSVIRTMPLALDYPNEFHHHIKITLPEPWTVESSHTKIEGNGIFYQSQVNSTNNEVDIQYTYKILKPSQEAEEAKALVAKHNEIIDDLGYRLFYSKSITQSFTFSWLALIIGLITLSAALFFSYKLYQYNPLPSIQGAPREISGWLILFALGVFMSPLITLINLFSEEYYNAELWNRFMNAESVFYNPAYSALLGFEYMYNITILCIEVLLILLFFNKRSSFPRIMSVVMACELLFLILSALALIEMDLLSDTDKSATYSEISRSFIRAAIWIPYLNLSTRVKETFTVRLVSPEENEMTQVTYHLRSR